jgi:hypothetical protein
MPRSKKARRVTEARARQAKTTPPLAGTPLVLARNTKPLVSRPSKPSGPQESAALAPIPQPASSVAYLETPGQRLFWAWFAAGVDTMRFAIELHSAALKQIFEVSPASLAVQVHAAFHDRALA